MDWDSCFFCQQTKKETLRDRSTASTENSYSKISKIIAALSELDLFSVERFDCEQNGSSILERLNEQQAVYHHNCVPNSNHTLTTVQEKRK